MTHATRTRFAMCSVGVLRRAPSACSVGVLRRRAPSACSDSTGAWRHVQVEGVRALYTGTLPRILKRSFSTAMTW